MKPIATSFFIVLAVASMPAFSAKPKRPPAAEVNSGPQDPMTCARMTKSEARASDCKYPDDVLTFLDDRAICEHWLGETGYDATRRAIINQAINKTCNGLDDRLSSLHKKYRKNAGVTRFLSKLQNIGK
jgi:hypothetical protein